MLAAFLASAVGTALLALFPQAMFPNSQVRGVEWLLPLIVFAVAGSDVALAALAYRHNIRATVTARAIIEPWTISIAATVLYFTLSSRDGLIIAYVISMRSEEHTSELQSLMRISYAVLCLKKKNNSTLTYPP